MSSIVSRLRRMASKYSNASNDNAYPVWSYAALDAFIRERGHAAQSRKIAGNTYVARTGTADDIGIYYHQTYVATFHKDGSVTLNSGGWQTMTTKERINAFCPWSVYADKRVWYVSLPNNPRELFVDRMRITAKGRVARDVPANAARKSVL